LKLQTGKQRPHPSASLDWAPAAGQEEFPGSGAAGDGSHLEPPLTEKQTTYENNLHLTKKYVSFTYEK